MLQILRIQFSYNQDILCVNSVLLFQANLLPTRPNFSLIKNISHRNAPVFNFTVHTLDASLFFTFLQCKFRCGGISTVQSRISQVILTLWDSVSQLKRSITSPIFMILFCFNKDDILYTDNGFVFKIRCVAHTSSKICRLITCRRLVSAVQTQEWKALSAEFIAFILHL